VRPRALLAVLIALAIGCGGELGSTFATASAFDYAANGAVVVGTLL
jgi:hypothetical protein